MSQPLPGGLALRPAQPADRAQIAALLTDRGDADDAIDHGLIVDDPDVGWDGCAVVVDGDRVVSTAMLLDETLVLDQVPIPVGQVELVATDREYEGRGLVRALMGWIHELSARRGHRAQVLIGIPYFYRQFDYQYAIALPMARKVPTIPPAPEGFLVRPAGLAGIPAMAALQDAAQQEFDLRMPHSPACWRWMMARTGSTHLVVEHAGSVVGTARLTPSDDDAVLDEVAAREPAAVHALLAHAGVGGSLLARERTGCLAGEVLEPFLAPPDRQASRYYLRVPDPVGLLDHLRPVLSARLGASGLAEESGEVVVSFFRRHVRLGYAAGGAVRDVRPGGPMQAPGRFGGAGVAPDLVGPLLFGPDGLDGLAERHPDVYPGPRKELMRALFPPVRADVLTLYVP